MKKTWKWSKDAIHATTNTEAMWHMNGHIRTYSMAFHPNSFNMGPGSLSGVVSPLCISSSAFIFSNGCLPLTEHQVRVSTAQKRSKTRHNSWGATPPVPNLRTRKVGTLAKDWTLSLKKTKFRSNTYQRNWLLRKQDFDQTTANRTER